MTKFVLDPDTQLPIVLPDRYTNNGYTYTDLSSASDSFLESIGLVPIPPRPSGVDAELLSWDSTRLNWTINDSPEYLAYKHSLRCESCVNLLSGIILENITFANSVPGSESLYQSVLKVNEEIQATISGLKTGVYDCDTYPKPPTVSYNGIYIPV